MRCWHVVLLALVGSGCEALSRDGCRPGSRPRIEVGKGEHTFVASEEDGTRTELVHGLQGGYHTYVSLRGRHLSLGGPWAIEISGSLDGEPLAGAVLERDPECNPAVERGEVNGTWLIWDSTPEVLHDRTVVIEVGVEDVQGRVAEGWAQQVIWDDALAP